jgi:hypothetical protein
MLTCYIRNDFDDENVVSLYSILILPVTFVMYSIYAFIQVFKLRKVRYNKDFKNAIIKYLIYSALFLFFYTPTIILYVASINKAVYIKYTFFSWFSYLCSLANILVNLVLSIFRILEGYVKFEINFLCPKKDNLEESFMTEADQENNLLESDGEGSRKRFQTFISDNNSMTLVPRKKATSLEQIHAGNMKGVFYY